MAAYRDFPNLDHLIERYRSGESLHALEDEVGCGGGVLRGAFRRAGVPFRDHTASQRVRFSRPEERERCRIRSQEMWGGLTPEGRSQLVAAAHAAARGRKASWDERVKMAQSRERLMANASPAAIKLAEWLRERTVVPVVLEKAVGKYNVDIAVGDSVAVEVCGGGWHLEKRHRARSAYIFDQGWNLIFVWRDNAKPAEYYKGHALMVESAEDVLTFLERTQRDPSFRRQYRMIWGTGQFISEGCADGDDWAFVGPHNRRMR